MSKQTEAQRLAEFLHEGYCSYVGVLKPAAAELLRQEALIAELAGARRTRKGEAMSAPLLTDEQIEDLFADGLGYESKRTIAREIESAVRAPLLAEIDRLTAERDAAIADAERYRWLRSDAATTDRDCPAAYMMDEGTLLVGEELDAAIDAARSAT